MSVMQINLDEPSFPSSLGNTSASNYESNSTISLNNGRTNTISSVRQEPQNIPAKSKYIFN